MGLKKAAGAFFACLLMHHCSGSRPPHVGEGHGNLAPCPPTPNCVSTHAEDQEHAMRPMRYSTDRETAMKQLVAVVDSMPRSEIAARTENYLYAKFTSRVWRFVDDVEFDFDPEKKIVHFRSASRLGKNDLGVNRKRMKEIRERFEVRQELTD